MICENYMTWGRPIPITCIRVAFQPHADLADMAAEAAVAEQVPQGRSMRGGGC
jgi:hypothetical protein